MSEKNIVDRIDEILRSNLLFSGMTYEDTLECAEEIYEDIIKPIPISLKEALKHLSDNYMTSKHECDICNKIIDVFDKYEFSLPKKEWDRDE